MAQDHPSTCHHNAEIIHFLPYRMLCYICKKTNNEFPKAQQVSLRFGTPLSRDKALENQMNRTKLNFPKTGGFQQVWWLKEPSLNPQRSFCLPKILPPQLPTNLNNFNFFSIRNFSDLLKCCRTKYSSNWNTFWRDMWKCFLLKSHAKRIVMPTSQHNAKSYLLLLLLLNFLTV